jgi:MFS family permease
VDRDALSVVPEASHPEVVRPRRVGGAFRALRIPAFRRYFVGQIVSASGTFVQQTAIGWAVLAITGSASMLGVALAAGGLPYLLFGPFGGSIADRYDNRRLLLLTQTGYALLAAALWLIALTGHLSASAIIAIGIAGGVVQIVDSPTRQAFVSQLVSTEDLASAVSLNGVVMNGSRVLGPALAGVLIVTTGTTVCFAVNAASYLVCIAALATIRPTQPVGPAKTRGGVRQALHYVSRHQQLYLPLTMMALVGLVAFNFNVVLPLLARITYHGSGGTYGLLSTVLSIGSVAGSLVVGALGHPRRRTLLIAAVAFGGCLGLTALAPTVATACGALFLAGFSGFALVTTASTSLQIHAAPAYRGRVMALWVFVYVGTTPIGSLATGWLSTAAGPRAPLWAAAAASLVAAGLAARVRTPPNVDAELVERD